MLHIKSSSRGIRYRNKKIYSITCHTVPNRLYRAYFTVKCVSKTAYLLVLITLLSYPRKIYYLSSYYFYVTFIQNNSKFLIVAMSYIVFLVHTFTTQFCRTHFIIILWSTPEAVEWHLPSVISCVSVYIVTPMYATYLTHLMLLARSFQ